MRRIFYILLPLLLLAGCREEVTIFLPEHVSVAQPEFTEIEGFYLLCEGNMGWNKATLDYYDYAYGEYVRNIFSYANPTVPKEMGDVGNDIGIYGSNLYCVINCSNKIDVLDKYTCLRQRAHLQEVAAQHHHPCHPQLRCASFGQVPGRREDHGLLHGV